MRLQFLLTGILCLFVSLSNAAETFSPIWGAQQVRQAESFSAGQKIVGTHYFYWYDYPSQHFFDNGARTDDALQDHFVEPESVSFHSVEWHLKELQDCADAGIDFILPVYWGAPDAYFRPGIAFSVQGLGPLQKAVELRVEEGKTSPKIGLFYDTSSLLPGVRGVVGRSEKYDLTAADGKDIFYRTIRDFFYQIHPQHWACIDGRPVVVLYGSSFAKSHDQSTIDYVYEQFANDFHGVRPYVIKDSSWRFECDGTTQWGAALSGPNIFGHVAQVGAGYNDSAVPGRSTPIREREDGNFYRMNWNRVLDSDAEVVLVETWNEMHEGTDICESKEFGKQYIDLTREYVKKFKSDEKSGGDVPLKYPRLRPRPANDEGMEYKDSESVSISFADGAQAKGVTFVRGVPDGVAKMVKIEDRSCVQSASADHGYLYFNVVDPFYFDENRPVEVEFEYFDDGFAVLVLQYDSHDERAVLDGAYKDAPVLRCGNSKQWKTQSFRLEDARFVNRQNSGADLRFSVAGGQAAVSRVVVKK